MGIFIKEFFITLLIGSIIIVAAACFHTPTNTIYKDMERSLAIVSVNSVLGTGFLAVGESGERLIITNAHVCLQSNAQFVGLTYKNRQDDEVTVPAAIIKIYQNHDLCAIVPLEKTDLIPLKIATKVPHRESVFSAGYPLTGLLVVNYGSMVGQVDWIKPAPIPLELCDTQFFIRYMNPLQISNPDYRGTCLVVGKEIVTTIPTDVGGSGSPLLNENREVVGVMNIAVGNVSWGLAVPLVELQTFLKEL